MRLDMLRWASPVENLIAATETGFCISVAPKKSCYFPPNMAHQAEHEDAARLLDNLWQKQQQKVSG